MTSTYTSEPEVKPIDDRVLDALIARRRTARAIERNGRSKPRRRVDHAGLRSNGLPNHKPTDQYVPGVEHLDANVLETINRGHMTAAEEGAASEAIRHVTTEIRRRKGDLPQ